MDYRERRTYRSSNGDSPIPELFRTISKGLLPNVALGSASGVVGVSLTGVAFVGFEAAHNLTVYKSISNQTVYA